MGVVIIELVIKATSTELADTNKKMCGRESAIYDKPTCELVGELEKRMGVKVNRVAPYEPYAVNGMGPAIILIVED